MLTKRGAVYHYDFSIGGTRYRGSTHQTSRPAAFKVEAAERERAKLGSPHPAIPTLAQAADQWFTARAQGHRSALDTARRIKILMRHIDGALLVTEIGTPHVEAAVQARRMERVRKSEKGVARAPTPATVNRDIIDSTLRPIMNYCRETLELPVRAIKWKVVRLREPSGRTRSFTPDEIQAWRAELPSWHRPLFDFIARYGVRLREAIFAPRQFDARAGTVTIRAPDRKSQRGLVLPLLDGDRADIAARAARATEGGLETVWYRDLGAGKLEPIHWRGFEAASRAALDRAGIQDARPAHDLRHHAATQMRRAGADLALIQKLLGHEAIASTARYAHVSQSDVLEALRRTTDADPEKTPETPIKSNGRTGF